jgi:transcriptional regulator with XRE-family HTH domain
MAARDEPGPSPAGPATLAGQLRALRERALLTQEELAQRVGLSVRTIRDLDSGRVWRPRTGSLRLLARALRLTEPELMDLRMAAASGKPGGAPAPAVAPAVAPAQLPAHRAEFTGRERCLSELDELLPVDPAAPPRPVAISAITGMAAVGKTALAVHWAHRVAGRFPDGQLYVDLRGYAPGPPLSPIQALKQLLGGLGLAVDKMPVEVELAAGLYRSLMSGRRMLVVLDNALDPDHVRQLLPGSPGCVVLVTSRDGLAGLVASHGARRLSLDVLLADEAVALLARVLGEERVAAQPTAAAELAALCGCLPLALRIAAANLACHPGQPIAAIVGELRAGDPLGELAARGDPQTAVRSAFDLSYRRLPSDAQRLFRLLSLVPVAEVTVPAAAALAADRADRLRRPLEALVGAHMVEQRGPGRFGFHDLLRRYARERVERDDGDRAATDAVERLMDWYLRTADAAAKLVYPHLLRLPLPEADGGTPVASFADAAGASDWLDTERSNLVATVQYAASHGPRATGWLLADTLRGYFLLRRHTVDWLTVAEAAVAAATRDGNLRARAAAQLNLSPSIRRPATPLGRPSTTPARSVGPARRDGPTVRRRRWSTSARSNTSSAGSTPPPRTSPGSGRCSGSIEASPGRPSCSTPAP